MEHKIGLGKYQYVSHTLISLTQFADGAEVVGLSILLPLLKHEWSISDDQQSLLGSVLFMGFFIGSIMGGYISDKYGRRTALLWAALIQFIVGVLSTQISNVTAFILIRGIFGLIIGFSIPLGPAFASELTPISYRGRALVAINSSFSIGSLYAVVVAAFCLDSLTSGNWRAMLIWCSLPALIVWFGTLKWVKESPRYLIAINKINEGVEVLNYMAQVNNPTGFRPISSEEIEELKEWQRTFFTKSEENSTKAFFQPKYRKVTLLLWTLWFTLNFSFYGMTFILPFILAGLETATGGQSTSGLAGMALTIFGEVPSLVIGLYIIEKKSFGRKGTIIYSSIITCVLFLLAFIGPLSTFIPLLSIGRMLLKLNFAIMFPLCTELYPTTIRTAGVGFTAGLGRLGAALMPYVLIDMLDISMFFPIFVFSLCAAINAFAAIMLPYDTTGRHLDLLEDEEDAKKSSMKQKLIPLVKI